MDFLKLAAKRQSTRAYKDSTVPREEILYCIEAARIAPSASNKQPWKFVVADDHTILEKMVPHITNDVITFNRFIPQCPVIIAAVTEPRPAYKTGLLSTLPPFAPFDMGMAVENLCLAAADRGLGTCIIGGFEANKIKAILGIPEENSVGLLVALGYPADGDPIREKTRLDTAEIVSFNRY